VRCPSFCFGVVLLVVGCRRAPTAEPAPSHPTARNHVHVAANVQADARLRTERVAREVIGASVELAGEIVSDPDHTARVSSPVAGRLEQIRFGEGALVKRGETLAVLRVPDLGRIRGALGAAQAKAAAARADAIRLKGLAEKRLATEQAYLDAEAGAAALEAEAAALRDQLSAMGVAAEGGSGHQLVLRAPISGVVVSRDAVVGQPLPSDQTIATLADLSRVWFVGQVFERDIAWVEVGTPAHVRLSALSGRLFEGRVEIVGSALDPGSRSARVRIPLDNADGATRIAMTGVARVSSVGVANALDAGSRALPSAPRTAITDLGGRRVVFVRKGPEEFEARDVEAEASAGDRVGFTRGLDEGDEVVVDGVFLLKSIALKSTFAEQ
jgi:membrane fusion protein, heavy metal efflux system